MTKMKIAFVKISEQYFINHIVLTFAIPACKEFSKWKLITNEIEIVATNWRTKKEMIIGDLIKNFKLLR
jgi:hypothetical protein